MLSCRNSKYFHLNIRDAGVALGAHAHTAASTLPALNYVRCKNCVSGFRRPYIRRCDRRKYSYLCRTLIHRYIEYFLFRFFLSDSSARGRACVCVRISIAGSMN